MKRLNIKANFKEQDLESGDIYSFLNPASLGNFYLRKVDGVKYYIDGGLLVSFLFFIVRRKIVRVSFDYTSIAGQAFNNLSKKNTPVYIIGANQDELNGFIRKLKINFPEINLVGCSNGFVSRQEWPNIYEEIERLGTRFVLAGLGAGMQEDFIVALKSSGYTGTAFTCGGFIRQESSGEVNGYYPYVINKLSLRWLYRMYNEPHTIKRYLYDYPKNLWKLVVFLVCKKIKINIL